MAQPGGGVLVGVLTFLAVALIPTVVFWLALRVPWLVRKASRLRRRPRPDPLATPPVEQVAADIRRVHRLLMRMPEGASYARRRGAEQAYEDLLVVACRAVRVEHRLGELPDGVDRDIERLRVEAALQEAGLVIRGHAMGPGPERLAG